MNERQAPWPADHTSLAELSIDLPSCSSPLVIEQRAKSSYVETGAYLSPSVRDARKLRLPRASSCTFESDLCRDDRLERGTH